MTSEVLMLNKDAVVIAADSAVTTGRDPHPRYSKAANKIFDLSFHGNVAVTIYSAAEIDSVPWELALKLFRKYDANNPQYPKLKDYVGVLVGYLQGNPQLFPPTLKSDLLKSRFFQAAIYILNKVETLSSDFTNQNINDDQRINSWNIGYTTVHSELSASAYQGPLTQTDHIKISTDCLPFQLELANELAGSDKYKHANPQQLTELAIDALLKQPTNFLSYTGLVIAGYGAEEIFPSFQHILLYGHIGDSLLWTELSDYSITHSNEAWIQPFAQSSMIDRFTDGFDNTLNRIINQSSLNSFQEIVKNFRDAGIQIDDVISNQAIEKQQKQFMDDWKKKNWEKNFHPLRRVLNSLSVPEMGHLAESLLVLEALRERVTSPSESVGGPIDVVAVTKSEGLLWLKRKHFFDPGLNIKYLNRSKSDYN